MNELIALNHPLVVSRRYAISCHPWLEALFIFYQGVPLLRAELDDHLLIRECGNTPAASSWMDWAEQFASYEGAQPSLRWVAEAHGVSLWAAGYALNLIGREILWYEGGLNGLMHDLDLHGPLNVPPPASIGTLMRLLYSEQSYMAPIRSGLRKQLTASEGHLLRRYYRFGGERDLNRGMRWLQAFWLWLAARLVELAPSFSALADSDSFGHWCEMAEQVLALTDRLLPEDFNDDLRTSQRIALLGLASWTPLIENVLLDVEGTSWAICELNRRSSVCSSLYGFKEQADLIVAGCHFQQNHVFYCSKQNGFPVAAFVVSEDELSLSALAEFGSYRERITAKPSIWNFVVIQAVSCSEDPLPPAIKAVISHFVSQLNANAFGRYMPTVLPADLQAVLDEDAEAHVLRAEARNETHDYDFDRRFVNRELPLSTYQEAFDDLMIRVIESERAYRANPKHWWTVEGRQHLRRHKNWSRAVLPSALHRWLQKVVPDYGKTDIPPEPASHEQRHDS